MKTHLLQPNDARSMCGVPEALGVKNPFEVECIRCFNSYSHNVSWYWFHRDHPVPGGARYMNIDSPLPISINIVRGRNYVKT